MSQHLYPLPWQSGAISRVVGCAIGLILFDFWFLARLPVVRAIGLKLLLLAVQVLVVWTSGVVSAAEFRRGYDLVMHKLRRTKEQSLSATPGT